MTSRSLARGLPALALAVTVSTAVAGDGPLHRSGREVVVPPGMPCQNCEKYHTRSGSDCPTCLNGKYGIGWKKRPTVPTLAPGACFGYFPTQWNKWEDVCPIPYPGAGITDPPTTSTAAKKADPKKDSKTDPKPDVAPPPKPSSDSAPPADPTGKGADGKGGDLPKPGTLPNLPEVPKGGTLPTPNLPKAPPGGKF